MAKILCFSDVFLLPSETESFGLAALEAMASGVPVITSNTGGLPEVVDHGISGYLTDVGDVESMVKHAIHLFESEERLVKFKVEARKKAKVFFDVKIIKTLESLTM